MARHIDLVGICWMLYGGLQLLVALVLGIGIFGLGGMIGAAGVAGGEDELAVMGGLYAVLGPIVGVIAGVFAILDILAGVGIRQRAKWGRILGFVAAVLSVGSLPLGTLLGVFTFVVLLDKEAAAEFDRPQEV
ncbi:MAG: hypothetical protein H0V89_05605 [Deltaproteobacteria bacterium]|nr:hypothetical protein [Deltaproteobacteria bacterium]